jgi:hypothetical protein
MAGRLRNGRRRPGRFVAGAAVRETRAMAVRTDCRHYSTRTVSSGDQMQRCRLGVNEEMPFACPEGCLFFEPRSITDAGWTRDEG